MQRILDVLIAAVILAIPALAVAQAPASSLAPSVATYNHAILTPIASSSAPSNPPAL